jgi:hypothetical protein
VGLKSMYSNTTGFENIAFGLNALFSNTTGKHNNALGKESLYSNTSGNYNSALGFHSLYANTAGGDNIGVGWSTLSANTTGNYNTAIGNLALISNNIGSNNTAIGIFAGSTITSGQNLTCVGSNAWPTTGTATNQITLGDNQITSLRCNVTTITSLSDARDKKNIKDLNLGLDFIMKVKPRIFNWDKREWYENNISNGSKLKETPTAGFIAQELDEVQNAENAEWLNLVLKDNPEKLEATPGNLLPIMVRAIQQLKLENDNLRQNNEMLASEVESLKSMSEKLMSLEKIVNNLISLKYTSNIKSNENKTISNKGDSK